MRRRLSAAFDEITATTLICSAANGADLIALQIALERHIDIRIILPVDIDRFSELSVTDRPGGWDRVFRQVVGQVGPDAIVILSKKIVQDDPFTKAVDEILNRAGKSADKPVIAIVAWDGKPRAGDDVTAYFRDVAEAKRIPVRFVSTLE